VKSTAVHFSIEANLPNDFLSNFSCRAGVLNKDPTVWLYGARPANTCILPSFSGNTPALLHGIPTTKVCLQIFKKMLIAVKSRFYDKKIRF
jgi:hypothetical protein